MSTLDPRQLAWLDRHRAESREDLNGAIAAFRVSVANVGEDDAVGATLVKMADEPTWARVVVIAVFVEALARIVALEGTPTHDPEGGTR